METGGKPASTNLRRLSYIGVDVGAKQLHAARLGARGKRLEASFRNDASGHARLIAWATRGGCRAQVCMEATGRYSLPLALALHAHRQTDVMVVNPRVMKSFSKALLQRAKTDRTDAEVIRTLAEKMPFVPWQSANYRPLCGGSAS